MKRIMIIAVLVMTAAAAPGFRYLSRAACCVCDTAGAVASPILWHLADQALPHANPHGASDGGVTDQNIWRAAYDLGDLLFTVLPQVLQPEMVSTVSGIDNEMFSTACRFDLVSFVVQ